MSEISRYEDGFNVIVIQCDGCEKEIQQAERADDEWFSVSIDPLARDTLLAGDSICEFHFCSTQCFRDRTPKIDPTQILEERD